MKRILAVLLASMLLVAVGCSKVEDNQNANNQAPVEYGSLKIAGLKGPTTMGIVKLMEDNKNNSYEMFGTADEAAVKLTKGELDVALVPANLAAVLYQKTQGQVQIAGINTLGVLYIVEKGETINSMEDLKGKTIASTGKGTTPEYVLNYLLAKNNLQDQVNVEFKAESTEVVAALDAGKANVAVLPQPYVTTAITKNPKLRVALDLTEEWGKVDSTGALVTGVVLVRKEVLDSRKNDVDKFLGEYEQSINYVNGNAAEASVLIEKQGIAPAEVAQKAIHACNLVLITGEEMREKLMGYFGALHEQSPAAVGGSLPDEGIFYNK